MYMESLLLVGQNLILKNHSTTTTGMEGKKITQDPGEDILLFTNPDFMTQIGHIVMYSGISCIQERIELHI